jgi:hypothetical protein
MWFRPNQYYSLFSLPLQHNKIAAPRKCPYMITPETGKMISLAE